MFPNVARSERAEDGISDGVTKNIGIRMSFESVLMWDVDAAENQFASTDEAVRIVTYAATKRSHSFKSTTPFVAMML